MPVFNYLGSAPLDFVYVCVNIAIGLQSTSTGTIHAEIDSDDWRPSGSVQASMIGEVSGTGSLK